jgi:hypothetical protein
MKRGRSIIAARSIKNAMLCVGALIFGGISLPALAQTTYTYTAAPNYNNFINFTPPCTIGPCANYTSGMHPTGSFTTAAPLGPNLSNVDIAAMITSFSFSDGINTYTSPNGRIIDFHVYTDASGIPTNSTFFDLQTWNTGGPTHMSGDRFSIFSIDFSASVTNNDNCSTVGSSGGTADTCISSGGDANTSTASNAGSGVWIIAGGPPPPATNAPVPTLSTWAMVALATLVTALGWLALRRRL